MITLQFLDEGETFLVPLDPQRPLEIGAAAEVDVRLGAAGIAARHCRLVSSGQGFRVERCGSAEVMLNGVSVDHADLKVGDRLGIGAATVVVGRQQRRTATADDVLQERVGGRRRRRASSGGGRWKVVLLVLLVVAGVTGVVMLRESNDQAPAELARVEDLRQRGRFDEARSVLEGLRGWATGGSAARRDLLDQEFAALAAVEEAVNAGQVRLRDDARQRTFAELYEELASAERDGASASEREAARILRGDLRDLIDGVRIEAPATTASSSDASSDAAAGDTPEENESVHAQASMAAAAVLEAVEDQVAERAFVQALETLRLGSATAEPAVSALLAQRKAELEATVQREARLLIAEADRLADAGDLAGAVALLSRESWRYPSVGSLCRVSQELAARRVELDRRGPNAEVAAREDAGPAGDAAAGGASSGTAPNGMDAAGIAGLQGTLRALRDRELEGDLAAASELSATAAAQIGDADPAFARRMQGQAHDLALLAEAVEVLGGALARVVVEKPVSIETADGTGGIVTGVDLRRVRLESNRGEETLTWLELDPATLAGLASRQKASPRAWLGVAVHAYRHGQRDAAEDALRRALAVDAGLEDTVHGVIARGRGEPADSRYQLDDGAFVSARVLAARKVGETLRRQLTARLRRSDFDGAAALVEEAEQGGPEVLDAIVVALRDQRADAVEALSKLPLRKAWDDLAKLRERLDQARNHARTLIYDEQKYFYPFRPPQVSADKAAEYWPVQQEVDARVAALRDVWDGRSPRLRVPRDLGEQRAVVDWLDGRLARLGVRPSAGDRDALEWIQSLPDAGEVTLQNFALSAEERALYDRWDSIRAFNERALAEVPDGARRQFEITNAYRAMFGHRPLAANLKLFAAAQGHSDEMSLLGYFSHFSPTEGRRSPYERMRLADYTQGVSENIAQNGSALGAHNAWCHSAGHHRNLLNPNHTEFGVGVAGRYYTQNFGRGGEYEAELEPRTGDRAGR